MNGTLLVNNTAYIKDLEVKGTTNISGTIFNLDTNDIRLTGNIRVTGGNIFKVNGNIDVDTLTYKKLVNDNTSAQVFVAGQAITQMEVSDFEDNLGNGANKMIGYATFKTDTSFFNSSN
jgi:hypothetical protein